MDYTTSFDDFFNEHYASLCFFANRFLKDAEQAEDIVSEVAIKVWEKRDTIRHAAALKTYFYTSIRNACITALRRQKNEHRLRDINQGPLVESRTVLENIIHTEVLHELELALNNLPPQCRNVFTKLYVEGKSISETAADLQLSINTIKTHRQRGLKIIRGSISHLFLILATPIFILFLF